MHIFKPLPYKKRIEKLSANNYWEERWYDENDYLFYYVDCTGLWVRWEHDGDGDATYYENSFGVKIKRE